MHRLVGLSGAVLLLLLLASHGVVLAEPAVAEPAVAEPAVAEPAVAERPWTFELLSRFKSWRDRARSDVDDDDDDNDNDNDKASSSRHALDFKSPCAVRKMSGDEGEKFYMDYWQFDFTSQQQQQLAFIGERAKHATDPEEQARRPKPVRLRPRSNVRDDGAQYTNGSTSMAYSPAFLVHTDEQVPFNPHSRRGLSRLYPRSGAPGAPGKALGKREFKCPSDTDQCASIGRPTSCCAQGETCQLIPGSGLGDVGCCSTSSDCVGQVNSCDDGFTGCAQDIGGGCCIPGYVCVDEGCAPGPEMRSLVVVTPTVTTTLSAEAAPSSTSLSESSSSVPSSSAAPETPMSTVVSITTTTASTTVSAETETTSSSPSTSSTLTTSTSAPSSATPSSDDQTLLAPIRPTSGSGILSTTTGTDTITEVECPTGFYQCEAVYRGGCCRVGRDCDSTSCPPTASTTLQSENGITIVVPTDSISDDEAEASKITAGGAAPTEDDDDAEDTSPTTLTSGEDGGESANGRCATGWYSCAANVDGGCCPTGYACGAVDCQVTATEVPGLAAGGNVGKIPPDPSSASTILISRTRRPWLLLLLVTLGGAWIYAL